MSSKNDMKQWARFAMKMGLLLTAPKTWADMGNQIKEHSDDVVDRLRDARSALSRSDNNNWVAPTLSFLGGVALGAGIGMLFAPVSGEEARATLREKAANLTKKSSDMSSRVA